MVRTVPTGRGPEVVELPPAECPNGHPLRFPNMLVRHQPCHCITGGHRVYECVECGGVLYVPEHHGRPFGHGSAYG